MMSSVLQISNELYLDIMADSSSCGTDNADTDAPPCIVAGVALSAAVYNNVKSGACATQCLDSTWLACVGAAQMHSDSTAAPAADTYTADVPAPGQDPLTTPPATQPASLQPASTPSQSSQAAATAALAASSEIESVAKRQPRRTHKHPTALSKKRAPPPHPPPPAPLPSIPLASQRLARSWAAGDYGAHASRHDI